MFQLLLWYCGAFSWRNDKTVDRQHPSVHAGTGTVASFTNMFSKAILIQRPCCLNVGYHYDEGGSKTVQTLAPLQLQGVPLLLIWKLRVCVY